MVLIASVRIGSGTSHVQSAHGQGRDVPPRGVGHACCWSGSMQCVDSCGVVDHQLAQRLWSCMYCGPSTGTGTNAAALRVAGKSERRAAVRRYAAPYAYSINYM